MGQKWDLIYQDKAPKALKKGDFSSIHGMFIERDFYMVSALPMRRKLTMIGQNATIKTSNGQTTQVFYFDWKTRGIKSK